MQTLAFNLTDQQWIEVLDGNHSLAIQVKTANNVRLHFNDSDTPPALDADHILIESWPSKFDFECQNQVGQAHVWAMADRTPAKIVVVRRSA